jgi:hypothetical protein
VFDLAHLLLNGSVVSNNSVKGFGGGLRLEGRANVTITGGSRVHGNNASEDGGGLVARGRAVQLRVDGNSSLSENSAGQFGGGLAAFGNVSITFTGGSSVQGNDARNRTGVGLALRDSVQCVFMAGSRVHGKMAARGGEGLFATNGTFVSILGCSIDHNAAGVAGGGIAAFQNARVMLDSQSTVSDNTAELWGGGLNVADNASVIITGGSRVQHNVAHNGSGGGLAVGGGATVTLAGNSSVHSNSAKLSGGGLIVVDKASVMLTVGSMVQRNFAREFGGGLAVTGDATVELTGNSSVSNNTAELWGGGLDVADNANVTITGGSSVEHNVVRNGFGGGLSVRDNADLTLTGGSSVQGNTAEGELYGPDDVEPDGGGLWLYGNVSVKITDGSSVQGNTASGRGGGLSVQGINANVTLSGGSSVQHNIARKGVGGGLYVRKANVTLTNGSSVGNNSAGGDGGGLALFSAHVTIAGGSSVGNNTASGDGGGLLAMFENATVALKENSTVHSNTAQESGGGIFVNFGATVAVTGGSVVHGNTAREGGGMRVIGEANTIVCRISDGSVNTNTAIYGGGGLDVYGGSTVIADGSSVHSNQALDQAGGGLRVSGGALVTISNQSTVSNNMCGGKGVEGGGGGIDVDRPDASAISMVPDQYTRKYDRFGRAIPVDLEYTRTVESLRYYDGVTRVIISNSTVSNNTSNKYAGGGLAVSGIGIVELVHGSVVSHNKAVNSSGGGVVMLGSSTLHADVSVVFVNNIVSRGYMGSTIAAFDNCTLNLPLHGGNLTKCSVGVYLGWSICKAGEVLQHDVCVYCQPHTFSFTNASCEPCPRDGVCAGGSLVQPLPGYWSSANTSVQMHRCPLSTTSCNYISRDHQCNEGYTGPLCGACQLPRFGTLGPFECGKCMENSKLQLGVYLAVSGGSVFFVTYTVHATWKDNLTGGKVVLATDMIKVLVQFLQYIAIIGSVSVPWPLFSLKHWFQAVNIPFAGATGQTLSLDCWLVGFPSKLPLAMQRQLVYFLAPMFVLLAVVALLWLFWALGRWVVPLVRRPKEGAIRQPAQSVVRKLPVTLMVVAFYSYPTLLRASLSFFACLRIDRSANDIPGFPTGATAPLNHTLGYWVSDIAQQCFVGWHKGWALGLGLPSIIVWCIVVPVTMGMGLFLCRAKADEDSFREHFGFLYRSYKPERMWWEAVWAARTVVPILISVFAIPMERYYAVLSLLVVFLVSAVFQPYAFATLHHMHMVSTSCLAATTLGALAMLAYDIQESTAKNLRIAVAVMVMVVNVAFVGWCLWKLMPAVKGWCVAAYSMIKPKVLWVVNAALMRVGCPPLKAGQGRGRGRRGGAGCCV